MTISYEKSSFGRIRQVVNKLKHEPGGVKPAAREDPDLPLQVLDDLLQLLRDEMVRKKLKPFKSGPVLAGPRRRQRLNRGHHTEFFRSSVIQVGLPY